MLPTASGNCMKPKKRTLKRPVPSAAPRTEQQSEQQPEQQHRRPASGVPAPDVAETGRNGIALGARVEPAPKRAKSSASLASSEFSVVSLALPQSSRPSSAASTGGSTQFLHESTSSLKSKASDGKQRVFQVSLAMVAPRV